MPLPWLNYTLTGHSNWVWSVAFSPDGRTLTSGSDDGTIKLWDVATQEEIATLTGHSSFVYSVALSPDGRTLASGSGDRTIKLWDVATGRLIATLTGHSDGVWSVAFSPDGRTLASGSGDETIKLWDVATPGSITTLTGHSYGVFSVALSPDGRTLASGSRDNTIKLWDVATQEEIATLTGHSGSVWSLAFSPDGRTLASGSGDRTIKLWDVATQGSIATLTGHSWWVYSVALSPDGRTLASGSWDGTIKLWDVATGRSIATLTGHSGSVWSLAFSPDGRTLASGSGDETIKIWQMRLKSDNNDKGDEEDDGYEEDDEQPPVLSPEERKRIKAENINNLHRTVKETPELSKLKNAANNDAWEDLTEWIAESICDINFNAASKSVTRLITRVRHKTPREIAQRLIIHKSLQAAGLELIGDVVATVNNILDGLGAEGVDLPQIAKLGAEMVYQIADIYGFNMDDPERKQEALFIFGFIFLGEKIIDIGIDWLKLGYINNKLLKVGIKALMIYGLGHAACFYYEYKAKSEFSLIPPDNLLNKLRQERDDYFPNDVSEATVKQKLIVEISIAFPEINYKLLECLLAEKKWREADAETEYIISELLNREIKDDTSKIFAKDINQIDELWYHYSQGKFGFQVQRDIFHKSDINKKIGKFGQALGWRGKAFLGIGAFSWKDYDKLVFELDKSPKGHLPAFWFDKYEKHKGFIVKSYLKPILERDDWHNIKALP